MVEVTPEVRRRNRLVALACVAFAFSVYSYSIRQLKQVGFVLAGVFWDGGGGMCAGVFDT